MSSPLGGVYIERLNKQKKACFQPGHQINVKLDVTLIVDGKLHIQDNYSVVVGDEVHIQTNNVELSIQSYINDAQLLVAQITLNLHEINKKYANLLLQTVHLSPSEPITTLVEGNNNITLMMCATPIN